ncbi:hypothetical protein DO72_4386 [Burkholderia pseudomallei]|nr:hypothetical protein DO72_4386 [Burkholderia pseudomallei]
MCRPRVGMPPRFACACLFACVCRRAIVVWRCKRRSRKIFACRCHIGLRVATIRLFNQ